MMKQMSITFAAVLLLVYVKPSEEDHHPKLCWTKWYNGDHVSGQGDFAILKDLRKAHPGEICPKPQDIQAVTVHGEIPAERTNQRFYAYNTNVGFICRNEDQKSGKCRDYKVRFQCPC